MKFIQSINEAARNAAQAQEALNQAVIHGESTAAALQDLASFVGAQKAQMFLDHARGATAERNERVDAIKESAWGKMTSALIEASLADLAAGKEKTRVTKYPKTNMKRFADEWNENMGAWVRDAENKGYRVEKRVNASDSGEEVFDVIDEDKLVSTLVVSGHDDLRSGQYAFNYYNQTDVHQHNKYRINPQSTSYEASWQWKEFDVSGTAHNDTRNLPMSNKDVGNSGRVDDTDGPEGIIQTPRRQGTNKVDATDSDRPEVPVTRRPALKNADAAGAWGKLTKPTPGRKT